MIELSRPLAFVDCETTGLDPQVDRILTLAYEIHLPGEDKPILDEWKFNPGVPIPMETTLVHGITDEMAQAWPKLDPRRGTIIRDRLAECDFGGFNVGFDLQMISEELYRVGLDFDLKGKRILDVGMLFKKEHRRDLSAAVALYLNRNHDGAHGAKADAIATREVFEMMPLMNKTLDGKDFAAIADFSMLNERDGSLPLDLAGTFRRRPDGVIVFGTKRNRGVPVKDDVGYAQWISRANFPRNTRVVLAQIAEELQLGLLG